MNEFFVELEKHYPLDVDTFDEIRHRFGLLGTVEPTEEQVEALEEAYDNDEVRFRFVESHDKSLTASDNDENFSVVEEKFDVEETVIIHESSGDFICHICSVDFKDMQSLEIHCHESHSSHPQVMCICGEVIDSLDTYNSHQALHHNETEYNCDICNITYKTQVAFEKHKKLKHGENAEKFICRECGKEFKDKQLLRNHSRSHLPNELKLRVPCPKCDKKFVNNHCMKIHVMRIHEKCAVFSCDFCPKTFVTRSDLNWHLDKHTEERNFECEICKCKFKSKNSLRIHKRRHVDENKYVCKVCGKEFNSSAALSNHKLVHSDVKRYKCHCGNEYKRLESYKCHQSVHSGERPFSCQWCTRTFVNSANCRKHKLKDHPVEVKEFELIHGKRGVALAKKKG